MPSDDSKTKLIALKCDSCGKLYVPPRYLCGECENTEFSEIVLEGKGEVYTYTTIRMPFEEFEDEAPYAFAEVKSDEGLVFPGRFTNEGEKELKIGSKVSFAKRNRGVNWFELV
jgi:uncharacterized OB-fold protein